MNFIIILVFNILLTSCFSDSGQLKKKKRDHRSSLSSLVQRSRARSNISMTFSTTRPSIESPWVEVNYASIHSKIYGRIQGATKYIRACIYRHNDSSFTDEKKNNCSIQAGDDVIGTYDIKKMSTRPDSFGYRMLNPLSSKDKDWIWKENLKEWHLNGIYANNPGLYKMVIFIYDKDGKPTGEAAKVNVYIRDNKYGSSLQTAQLKLEDLFVLFPQYTDATQSRTNWLKRTPINRIKTLYWNKNKQLIWENNHGDTKVIDDMNVNPYRVNIHGTELIITDPSVFRTSMYPNCIGLPSGHPLFCQNKEIFSKDTIISQRFKYINRRYKGATLAVGIISHTQGKFDISISKIPGDFSDKACRSSQTYNRSIAVLLIEEGGKRADGYAGRDGKGGTHAYDENMNCWVNSNKFQNYYINIRSLETNPEKVCNENNECKFEIVSP